MKILVNPDIHGRKFWKKTAESIDKCDKIIFLGDYLDPYGFENISVEDAIANFEEIIDFADKNREKVVLLLGNHDMPYYSKEYYELERYHCRHSNFFHNDISKLFEDNKELFKIAHIEDDILFTHAGIMPDWRTSILGEDLTLEEICQKANDLLNDKGGISSLFSISHRRGGWDSCGSCIWADVDEIASTPAEELGNFKQIFGHTLQAFYGPDGTIVYGDAIENGDWKMLDTANPYELDTENFEVKKID